MGGAAPQPADELYLDLLKRSLTRIADPEHYRPLAPALRSPSWYLYEPVRRALGRLDLEVVRRYRMDLDARAGGLDRPPEARTMIGLRRLDHLQACIDDVLRDEVAGDFIETGVWRGGACIFMRGMLQLRGDDERIVWVADSFAGLPRPDLDRYPQDREVDQWRHSTLAVSMEEVTEAFRAYGLLDERVRFLPGWFRETLPAAPIERLAILRLDGDLYESTMEAFDALYDRVTPGGYIVVDDYGAMKECRAAVDDFRARNEIREPIEAIDDHGIAWRITR